MSKALVKFLKNHIAGNKEMIDVIHSVISNSILKHENEINPNIVLQLKSIVSSLHTLSYCSKLILDRKFDEENRPE